MSLHNHMNQWTEVRNVVDLIYTAREDTEELLNVIANVY